MSIGRNTLAVLALSLCAWGVTPSLVQQNQIGGVAGSFSSQSVTLSSQTVAFGDAIIAQIGYGSTITDMTTTGCTDSNGNLYTVDVQRAINIGGGNGAGGAVGIAHAINQVATPTLLVTCFTNSTHGRFGMNVQEWTNAYSVTPLDASASCITGTTCSGTAAELSISYTLTTNIANDAMASVLYGVGGLGTMSFGSGWTGQSVGASNVNFFMYQVAGAATGYTVSYNWTNNLGAASAAVAIKAGTAPAPGSGNFVNACENLVISAHSLACTINGIGANHELVMTEEIGVGLFNTGAPTITNSGLWSLTWTCPATPQHQTALGAINNNTVTCYVNTGSNSGNNTFTVTPPGGPDYIFILFSEWTNTTGVFDTSAYATTSSTSSETASITTSATDLIIQFCRWSSNAGVNPPPTLTVGSGMTTAINNNNFWPLGYSSGVPNTSAGFILQSRTGAAGTYTPGCSSSSNGSPWSLPTLAFGFSGGFSYTQVF